MCVGCSKGAFEILGVHAASYARSTSQKAPEPQCTPIPIHQKPVPIRRLSQMTLTALGGGATVCMEIAVPPLSPCVCGESTPKQAYLLFISHWE